MTAAQKYWTLGGLVGLAVAVAWAGQPGIGLLLVIIALLAWPQCRDDI